jgi:SAM-dependent methyltransferase
MARYTVDSLQAESPAVFSQKIQGLLGVTDPKTEGYVDPSRQRDLSVKFHWGHDHDFGAFRLKGRMGDRHLWLLANFIDRFGVPRSLAGSRVLDIGCWTGGTSLLLAAMGAEVLAIEEVKKYVDVVAYLAESFAVPNLRARHLSLYDCSDAEFQDAFDYVLLAGVLYHVTDPVLALRISFNALKDGGRCLLETQAIQSQAPTLRYAGPTEFWGGAASDLSRTGWDWLIPSGLALGQMIRDVGFQEASVDRELSRTDRLFALGRRTDHQDMLRAGLSARVR